MGNTLHDLLARVDHIRDECDGVPAVLHTYAASDLWEILNGLADASRKLADRLDSAHRREEALLAGAPPATREQLHHEWRAGFDARYAAESAAPPEAPQPRVLLRGHLAGCGPWGGSDLEDVALTVRGFVMDPEQEIRVGLTDGTRVAVVVTEPVQGDTENPAGNDMGMGATDG